MSKNRFYHWVSSLTWTGRFWSDSRGGVAPFLAIAAIPVFGLVGASVDYSRANAARAALQAALDSTALAVAKTASPNSQVSAEAQQYFNAVFVRPELENIEVSATAAATADGVSVTVSGAGFLKTAFVSVLGFTQLKIAARASAATITDGLGCVLALNPSASGAITASGMTTVNLNNCSLYDNSNNAAAFTAGGSVTLSALSIGVVGNTSLGGANVTATQGIQTGLAPISDPYADVSVPSFGNCTENKFSAHSTKTIDPGVYCNGFSVNAGAHLTLNPGVYYLDRGSFSVNGGATISGQGVTLVFTSSTGDNWAAPTINGNATVNLTPPNFGPTAGIVMFGDRNIPTGTSFKLSGGASQYLSGAIYVPRGAIEFSGGTGTSASCTQIIGDTVSFTGNAKVAINCSGYKTRPFGSVAVRLTS